MHAHAHTSARGHGNTQMALGFSPSLSYFPPHLCFYPFLFPHSVPLPSAVCILRSSFFFQLLCPRPKLCACARAPVYMCVHVEHRDGESRSRGRSLTYGKEKTRTRTTHTHVNTLTLCAVVKLVYYERGGDDTDKPWELPGQSAPLRCSMKTTDD